jgi:hypothetical protein
MSKKKNVKRNPPLKINLPFKEAMEVVAKPKPKKNPK